MVLKRVFTIVLLAAGGAGLSISRRELGRAGLGGAASLAGGSAARAAAAAGPPVVVIGARGKTGVEVVRYLASRGQRVVAGTRGIGQEGCG